MANPPKKSATPKGIEIPPALIEQAIKVLKDPKVQELILEHGRAVIDTAKEWWASVGKKVWDKFGQKGLERRAASVRAAVAVLSKDSPDLAIALQPVTKSLDEVDQMLTVSAALPFAKRKRAHMKIDDYLDNLERGLFEAALRGADPNRET